MGSRTSTFTFNRLCSVLWAFWHFLKYSFVYPIRPGAGKDFFLRAGPIKYQKLMSVNSFFRPRRYHLCIIWFFSLLSRILGWSMKVFACSKFVSVRWRELFVDNFYLRANYCFDSGDCLFVGAVKCEVELTLLPHPPPSRTGPHLACGGLILWAACQTWRCSHGSRDIMTPVACMQTCARRNLRPER